MDEAFKEFIPEKSAGTKQQNVRLRPEDEEALQIIATYEGDARILPLLYEGVGRVITSRFSDPEWCTKVQVFMESRAEAHAQLTAKFGDKDN